MIRFSGRRSQVRMRIRRGLTLIEVMIALTILAGAMLSIAAYMTKFAKVIAASDVKATANEIAAEQLEAVKAAPRYTAIDSMYAGTVTMASPYVGYTRKTQVTRTGGGATDFYDYKTITVTVTNPRLSTAVVKTSVIAFF